MEGKLSRLLSMLESLAQKNGVGTLVICHRDETYEVFVEDQLLYLAPDDYLGKVDLASLLEIQTRDARLDDSIIEAALRTTDLRRSLLAETLLHRDQVDRDDFEFLVLHQLVEELLTRAGRAPESIFFQDGHVPESLIGKGSLTSRYPLAMEETLKSVRRRVEKLQKLSRFIPDQKEVFVLTEKGMAKKQEDLGIQKIFALLDGFRSLAVVENDCVLYPTYIESRIVEGLQEGWIKKTLLPEIRDVEPEQLAPEEAERMIPRFKTAIKYGADELLARQKFARLLLHLNRQDEAVIQFNFIGDTLFQIGRRGQALQAYFEGLKLSPGHAMIGEKILRIYHAEAEERLGKGNTQEAIKLYQNALEVEPDHLGSLLQLTRLYSQREDYRGLLELCDFVRGRARDLGKGDTAFQVVETALELSPGHSGLIRKRINLLLDFNEYARALDEMEKLALVYIENGQADKGASLVDKILRMDSSRSHLLQHTRQPPPRAARERHIRNRRWFVRAALVLVLLGLADQFWSYTDLDPLRGESSRAQDALALTELPPSLEEKARAVPTSREIELFGLAQQASTHTRRHPLSLFRWEARDLTASFKAAAENLKDLRQAYKQRVLDQIRVLVENGKIEDGRQRLALLDGCPDDDPIRVEATRIVEQGTRQELAAGTLFQEAMRLRKVGDLAGATTRLRNLLRDYPDSIYIRRIRFPISIRSAPDGARVSLDDGRQLTTPCILEIPAGATRFATITREGFRPRKVELKFNRGPGVQVFLEQLSLWEKAGSAPFAPRAPQIIAGQVTATTTRGNVEMLDLGSGKSRLLYESRNLVQPITDPFDCGSHVVILLNNGEIRRYRGGEQVGAALKLPALITPQAAHLTPGNLIVMGNSARQIQAYDVEEHRIVHTMPGPGTLLDLRAVDSSRVIGLTDDQQMFLADVKAGTISWTVKLAHPARGKPHVLDSGKDGRVALANTRGQIEQYSLEDGQPERVHDFGPGISHLVPMFGSRRALTVDERGEAHVWDLNALKKRSLGKRLHLKVGGVSSWQEFEGGIVIVQDTGQVLHLEGENLEPTWVYPSDAGNRIVAATLQGRHLVLVSQKGKLLAYELPH